MAFLSDMTGRPVADFDGENIGTLDDLIACQVSEFTHPEIVALVVRQARQRFLAPIGDVLALFVPAISLTKRQQDITQYIPSKNDLFLSRDVLDKQIIDTNGVRVVRVNDLELQRIGEHYFVANVDFSSLGLLRRLGMARSFQSVARRLGKDVTSGVISWDDVELLPGDQAIRLKVSGDRLNELHPADLAEILSDLSRSESRDFLETLDVKTLADTLEEIEPDFQASLVEEMPDERVADLLEEMAPDEAADLLGELPQDRSQELLKLMEEEDAADVRKLLAYADDTAGGIMNTEYISIGPHLTAEQAMAVLRQKAEEAETVSYIYVTDSDNHLLGVFSLRDLVLARPDTPVTEFMHHRIVTIGLDDSQDDAAQAIAKYNLVALPVVDKQRRIQGIVTADDALDKIIPTAWKKRLPRLYR